MSGSERWLEFRYQYIETGWFDYDRHKTIAAMQRLSERVPSDVLDSLPPLTVFAPSRALLGHVLPCGTGDSIFVYLAPRLEMKSQREVDFTVAHEFAHIVLRHYKPCATTHTPDVAVRSHADAPSEQDADGLAVSWGFDKPTARRERTRRKRRSGDR
jgi:hypothetical protein